MDRERDRREGGREGEWGKKRRRKRVVRKEGMRGGKEGQRRNLISGSVELPLVQLLQPLSFLLPLAP